MNDDPINLKSPLYQQNRRKIYKWLFLLLQQHHRQRGLKVLAFSGPEGINTPRFNLYFDGVRTPDGKPKCHFALDGDTVWMQMYQWAVGIFQPLRPSDPQWHPQQSVTELRTKEMMPWFNEQLRIDALYNSVNSKLFPIAPSGVSWAHAAERYLHSWNVLGQYLAAQPGFIRLEAIGGSGWWGSEPEYIRDAERFRPEVAPEDILIFRPLKPGNWLYWLHSGRIVRQNGESLDFYQMTKGGMPLDALLTKVAAFMGDPKELVIQE